MSAIEITGLSKDYPTGFLHLKRVRALDGLSLTVERGEIFGFLGGNGAGKTTAIKILMRLMTPTAGAVRILDHDTNDHPRNRSNHRSSLCLKFRSVVSGSSRTVDASHHGRCETCCAKLFI